MIFKSFSGELVTFLVAVTKMPDRNNLREGRVSLAQRF
jgi:hypothetical protein